MGDVKINLYFNNLNSSLIFELNKDFKTNIKLWKEELLYNFECIFLEEKNCIQIRLFCNIWSPEKLSTLLESSIKRQNTRESAISFMVFKEMNVEANILKRNSSLIVSEDVKKLLNDFFKSLLISQLEFQFPMIFCKITRQKIFREQSLLNPVSHNLTTTSELVPMLLKLINDDHTSSLVYQILIASKLTCNLNII